MADPTDPTDATEAIEPTDPVLPGCEGGCIGLSAMLLFFSRLGSSSVSVLLGKLLFIFSALSGTNPAPEVTFVTKLRSGASTLGCNLSVVGCGRGRAAGSIF
jgi:hypothetical protein